MSLASQVSALATRIAQEVKLRGMPTGGAQGQMLTKSSGTNFAAAWTDRFQQTSVGNIGSSGWSKVADIGRNNLADIHLIAPNYDVSVLVWCERSVYGPQGNAIQIAGVTRVNSVNNGAVQYLIDNYSLYVKVASGGGNITAETRITPTGFGN